MNLSVFMTSLYTTCVMLAVLLVLIRMKFMKSLLQKQTLTNKEYLIIGITFSLLGIVSYHLPIKVYGTMIATVRVLIVSGGILFGSIVGIVSSVIISIFLVIVDNGCDLMIPEVLGVLTSGIISSMVYKIIEKYKIKSSSKWIIGIFVGIIIQQIALYEIYIYVYIVGKTHLIGSMNFSSINKSMAMAQIPIGIFVAVIQDIMYEKQSASLEQLKLELNNAKLEVLQSQINPHFLFNTLNVIGLLAGTEPEKAREVIVKLSKYIRHNLDLKGQFISIKEEIEQIKCYIYIQKTRFNNKFDILYDIDDNVDIKIPSLIMQPLVENALEHGILKSNEKGEIYVKVKAISQDRAYISIKNKGIPINEDVINGLYVDNIEKNKIGLRNVHIRLETIYGKGLTINRLSDGTNIEFYVGGINESNNSRR